MSAILVVTLGGAALLAMLAAGGKKGTAAPRVPTVQPGAPVAPGLPPKRTPRPLDLTDKARRLFAAEALGRVSDINDIRKVIASMVDAPFTASLYKAREQELDAIGGFASHKAFGNMDSEQRKAIATALLSGKEPGTLERLAGAIWQQKAALGDVSGIVTMLLNRAFELECIMATYRAEGAIPADAKKAPENDPVKEIEDVLRGLDLPPSIWDEPTPPAPSPKPAPGPSPAPSPANRGMGVEDEPEPPRPNLPPVVPPVVSDETDSDIIIQDIDKYEVMPGDIPFKIVQRFTGAQTQKALKELAAENPTDSKGILAGKIYPTANTGRSFKLPRKPGWKFSAEPIKGATGVVHS